VLKPREKANSPNEAAIPAIVRLEWLENFDRHSTIVLEILRQVNRNKSALADLALDIVPAAESRPEGGDRINHETPAKWVRKA